MTKTNRKVGRPTVFTPFVIGKLEEAAAMDCSIAEMALFADISRETLYSKLQDDKEFSDRIEALRNKPFLKARKTITSGLNDPVNAKWYLEKKLKKEFGNALDLTTGNKPLPLLNALRNNNSNKKDSETE